MTTLRYNGVQLEVVQVANHEKTPIWDGPTYLYTRHVLRARCVYNPKTTSYRLEGVGQAPLSTSDELPAVTARAIRHTLLQARRTLTLHVGNTETLISPPRTDWFQAGSPQYTVDSNNGPVPLGCVVTSIHGTKTFLVDFAIQTDINECQQATNLPATLISHRWTMSHSVDPDYYTTRTIKGRAIFRSDILRQRNLQPDDFRSFLFHPIPNGFRRDGIQVVADPAGNVLEYIVTDRELGLHVNDTNAPGLTRIEAFVTRSSVSSQWVEENLNNRILPPLHLNIPPAIGFWPGGLGPVGGILESVWEGFDKAIRQAPVWASGLIQNIPVVGGLASGITPPHTQYTVVAKAWGNKNSKKRDLERVVRNILISQMPIDPKTAQRTKFGVRSISINADLVGKYVEGRLELKFGPLGAAFDGVQTFAELSENESIPPNILPDGANIKPPGNEDARGTYLERVIAAALADPCGEQEAPTTPPGQFVPIAQV